MPYTYSGQFADGWDTEAANAYPALAALKEQHAGSGVRVMQHDLLSKLGPMRNSTPAKLRPVLRQGARSTRFAMYKASVVMTC